MLEGHLTIRRELDPLFHAWLKASRLKLTHLTLGNGPIQLMVTARWKGPPSDALEHAQKIAGELRERGAAVERIKIEAALEGEGGLYLEHHVKLRYPIDAREELRNVAQKTRAHFSSTVSSATILGFEERFLTRRFDIRARDEENTALRQLLETLAPIRARVLKVERERALYDDGEHTDQAWLGGAK